MNMIQPLYYFSSEEFQLVETKQEGLPLEAAMSQVYKWLIYSKPAEKFIDLSFRKMLKEELFEFRSFAEAELKFNAEYAELNYQNRQLKLKREDPNQIPDDFRARIEKYLLGQRQN